MEIRNLIRFSIIKFIKLNYRGIVFSCMILIFAELFPACSNNQETDCFICGKTWYIAGTETPANNITRFGITWTFDKEYETGQFANGDYWVVGPVTIIGFYPESIEVSGRIINGTMINPSPVNDRDQGFISDALNYVPALNIAYGVTDSNPVAVNPGSSVVSSISLTAEETSYNLENYGNGSKVKTVAILTVLSSAPTAGSFRPTYSGTDKTITHNVSELAASLSKLKKLPSVTDTPTLAAAERLFERPWLDHISGWEARAIKPFENLPDYGREISRDLGIGALMLHLDFTDDQKMTLLIRYIQVGLDLYGVVKNGGVNNWWPAGGQNGGRKWPILFAGIMLNDVNMQNIGQKSGDYLYHYDAATSTQYGPGNLPPDFIQFQEDDQTFYVTADDVTRTNSSSWKPDTRGGTPEAYTPSDIGKVDWGIFHSIQPLEDNRAWSAIYRICCTNISMNGIVLAARIMNADSGSMTLWNHPALFDYQDRYMAVTAASDSTPPWRYSVSGINGIWGIYPGWRSWNNFSENMWDAYRGNY